jgi:hypothetical protein
MSNEEIEAQRLEALLKERRSEYEIFGGTSEDAERDNEIILKIKELRANITPLIS